MRSRYQPGHTDMMVSPESLDDWLADNPLPAEAASEWHPISTAQHVKCPSIDLLVRDCGECYRVTDAWWCPDAECWYSRCQWSEPAPVTGEILGWMPTPDLTPPDVRGCVF